VTRVLKPLIDGQRVRVLDGDGRVVEIDPSPADRLRAVEIALKYGLGTADKVKVAAAARIVSEPQVIIMPEFRSESYK
jgi:hypothetical protein